MRLSVIIPTHDRVNTLRRTLTALAEQTLPAEEFEVIVVDDGSSPRTREQLRSLQSPIRIDLQEKPQGGLASARNHGADRARGEILHFLDDDVIPHPDSLREHLRSHGEASRPVAVVGSLPYPPELKLNAFLWYLDRVGHYDLYKNPRKYPGGRPPMPPLNGNSSIRRDVFFSIGKYDERFHQYGSEDLELGHRLAKNGIPFVYNPHAIGYHDHVKDFSRFCVDMETAGESLIWVYRKYPEIKASKKIDIVEDRFGDLRGGKKLTKLILSATLAFPFLLAAPRLIVEHAGRFYALRHLTAPFYRWIGHYHYAVGMRRGLAASR